MPYKGRDSSRPQAAGGRAVVKKYGRRHMAAIGRLGAQALLDQHGCEHMAEIGRAGYRTVMRRHGATPEPTAPIPWNVRRFMGAPTPTGDQLTLDVYDQAA